MDLIASIIVYSIVALVGVAASFVSWNIQNNKMKFGEYLEKYGEMMAYVGLIVIVIVIALVQWLST